MSFNVLPTIPRPIMPKNIASHKPFSTPTFGSSALIEEKQGTWRDVKNVAAILIALGIAGGFLKALINNHNNPPKDAAEHNPFQSTSEHPSKRS